MVFAAAIWLVGLGPWAAVAYWLLRGRPPRAEVPFLNLWKGPVPLAVHRRGIRPPPLFIAAGLLAALTAILAAAGPAIRLGGVSPHQHLVVIVDRGLSMSARGNSGRARFVELAEKIGDELRRRAPDAKLTVVDVPGGKRAEGSPGDLAGVVGALAPTAVDTHAMLQVAVGRELRETADAVLVLSDQARDAAQETRETRETREAREVWARPAGGVEDVGIALLAARDRPAGQVMVRVHNQSARTRATLQVKSGEATTNREIELPARGQRTDYFVDFSAMGPVVEAELLPHDALVANDRAWLVRQRSWPKLEPRATLPPALERMVAKYAEQRPPGEASAALAIVRKVEELPVGGPGIVVEGVAGPATRPAGTVEAAIHPITRGVDWGTLAGGISVSGTSPQGWQPILRAGERVLVAVRDQPQRGVWVGFECEPWMRSADFVIFWQNVFDWAGQGGEQYACHPVGALGEGWEAVSSGMPEGTAPGLWPGLYLRGDSAVRGVCAGDVDLPAPDGEDWTAKLRQLEQHTPRLLHLGGGLLVAGLVLAAVMAVSWPKSAS